MVEQCLQVFKKLINNVFFNFFFQGYAEHLVSTISEWLIAVADVIFFATFYKEFKQFRVHAPKIVYYNSDALKEALPNVGPNNGFSQSLPT